MTKEIWLLEPRDPLVIGDGRGPVPFVTRKTYPLPLPGTVAGMVRAAFVRDKATVSPVDARQLLNIRICGPWLVEMDAKNAKCDKHWVFAPADVVADADGMLYRGEVRLIDWETEGVLWCDETPNLPALVHLPEKKPGTKQKTMPLRFPLWPLEAVVRWALGCEPNEDDFREALQGSIDKATGGENQSPADAESLPNSFSPLRPEQRVHVSIDDTTQTAEPNLLFSSAGLRMRDAFALVVEVTFPDSEMSPGDRDLVILGGESRLSFRTVDMKMGFPAFADFAPLYAETKDADPAPAGIRLQLLTHALFANDQNQPGEAAWCPSWLLEDGRHPGLPADLRLQLTAVCMPEYVAMSGWNLQATREGAPREVRRLAPAGSVYYCRVTTASGAPASPQQLFDVCEQLWLHHIDPNGPGEKPDSDQFRAPSASDGYGLLLPGFWFTAQQAPIIDPRKTPWPTYPTRI